MRAEDLQIGDLLRVNSDGLCIKKGTIVELRGIDADDKLIEKRLIGSTHCRPLDDNQFGGGIWCEYLDPLPLTDEILKKNKMREFEHRNPGQGDNLIKKWWHKDGSYYVSLYSVGDEYTYTVGDSITRVCRIKYIHQLQHALRLCGITKEIQI